MPVNLLIRLGPCVLLALSLLGCPTGDDDDSAVGDDDDDTAVEYEEGCILVNGVEPGYAHLADALLHAQDGDSLTICPGEYTGSVTIDKSVSIIGVSSTETVIVGDVNEMAVTITAADVTLAHVSVSSTRNGIVAEGATGLLLDDVIVNESGQFGISLSDCEATINGSQLSLHPFGAIDAHNSVLTVTSSEITDIEGYGIRLIESTADISNTVISNVTVPEESDDYDGTCIYAEEASGPITLDSVMMDHCLRVAVYWFYSDVESSGCSISESNYGYIGIGQGDDGSVLPSNTLTSSRIPRSAATP